MEQVDQLNRCSGRVICYMKKFNLKYAFLTTYQVTVSIRRAEYYKVEISPPIYQTA